jgi:hypothetical protein
MIKTTSFNKESFRWDGEYLNYVTNAKKNTWGEFVARFKYNRRDKDSFVNFLVRNFTVEEYFAELAKGISPLPILESKGYLTARAKKTLKEFGLPPTPAGKKQYAMLVSCNSN